MKQIHSAARSRCAMRASARSPAMLLAFIASVATSLAQAPAKPSAPAPAAAAVNTKPLTQWSAADWKAYGTSVASDPAVQKLPPLDRAKYVADKVGQQYDAAGIAPNNWYFGKGRQGIGEAPGTCGDLTVNVEAALEGAGFQTGNIEVEQEGLGYYNPFNVNRNHGAPIVRVDGQEYVFDLWYHSGAEGKFSGFANSSFAMTRADWEKQMTDEGYKVSTYTPPPPPPRTPKQDDPEPPAPDADSPPVTDEQTDAESPSNPKPESGGTAPGEGDQPADGQGESATGDSTEDGSDASEPADGESDEGADGESETDEGEDSAGESETGPADDAEPGGDADDETDSDKSGEGESADGESDEDGESESDEGGDGDGEPGADKPGDGESGADETDADNSGSGDENDGEADSDDSGESEDGNPPEGDASTSGSGSGSGSAPGDTTVGYAQNSSGRTTVTETRGADGSLIRITETDTDKDGNVTGQTTYEGGTGEGKYTPGGNLKGAEPEAEGEVSPEAASGGVNTSDSFAGNWTKNQTQRGSDGGMILAGNTQMGEAANVGNQTISDADTVRDGGGRDYQTTRDNTTRTVNKADQANSWGTALGNAVEQGITEGGKAFGTALGGAAADQAVGAIFGSPDSGDGADEEDGADAGQVPASGGKPGKGNTSDPRDDEDQDEDDSSSGETGGGDEPCDDGSSGGSGSSEGTGGASAPSDDPLGVTGSTDNDDGTVTIRYGCGYSWTGTPPGPSRCPICSRETVSTETNPGTGGDSSDDAGPGEEGPGEPTEEADEPPAGDPYIRDIIEYDE